MTAIISSATTLFHLAAFYLGDPRRWNELAALNGLSDPLLNGLQEIELPRQVVTSSRN